MKRCFDVHLLSEDERITAIGKASETQIVGVFVDGEPADIAKRYIDKVTTRFQTVQLIKRINNCSADLTFLQFGPKATQ